MASVLYLKWDNPDFQKRIDDLIAGIARGQWFVSMECLLRNFDYALISPTGERKTIARSNESAWLTKHLRIYGGTGEYYGYKIGRLLRSFTFSGQGIVNNPANPKSIILPATASVAPATDELYKTAASWVGSLMQGPNSKGAKRHGKDTRFIDKMKLDGEPPLQPTKS